MANTDGDIVLKVSLDTSEAISNAEELKGKVNNTLKALSGERLSKDMEKFVQQTVRAQNGADTLRDRLQKLLTLRESGSSDKMKDLTKELEDTKLKAKAAEDSIKAVLDARISSGRLRNVPAYKGLSEEELYAKTKQNLLTGSSKNANFADQREQLLGLIQTSTELDNKIKELQSTLDQEHTTFTNSIDEQINRTALNLDMKSNQIERSLSNIQQAAGSENLSASATEQLTETLGELGSANNKASNSTQVFEKALHSLTNSIKKVIHSLIQLGKQALKTGFNALRNQIKGLGSSSEDSSKSVKKLLRTFIKYGFGVRSFFFLWRKLRTAIKDGFGDLAKMNGGINPVADAINQLKDSLAYLRNSWVAAFSPILQYVAPVLSYLMDLLSSIAHTIGSFFAVLTGKPMVKAIKKQTQLGTAVGDTADGLGKAGKNAEKVSHDLAEFDDLDVLKQPDDDTGSGGGGSGSGLGSGGLEEINGLFEEYTAENEWAEKIKEAWRNQDWRGVGKVIAEGLNKGLREVNNWINKKFSPQAKTWANRIGNIINGFVGEFEWDLLGDTIADAFNGVIDALSEFWLTVEWDKLGEGIGTALRTLLDTIHWDSLGEYFAIKWNSIIDFFYGLGTTLFENPSKIAGDIALAIQTLFELVDWAKLGDTLVLWFNSAVQIFEDLVNNTEMWNAINTGMHNLFTKLKDLDVGSLADSLSTLFTNAMDTVEWDVLGSKVGEFFGNLNWGEITSTILTSGWEFVKGAWSGFWEGDHAEDLSNILLGILAGKLALMSLSFSLKSAALKSIGSSSGTSLVSALGQALGVGAKGLGLVGGIIALTIGVRFALGKLSDSLREKGHNTLANIVDGGNDWLTVPWFLDFGGIVDRTKKDWERWKKLLGFGGEEQTLNATVEIDGKTTKAYDITHEQWENMSKKDKVTLKLAGKGTTDGQFKALTSNFFKLNDIEIKDLLLQGKGAKETAFSNLYDTWTNLKETTKTLLATGKGKITTTFTTLNTKWDNFKNKTATLTGQAKDRMGDIYTKMKGKWDSIVTKTETLIGQAKDSLGNTFKLLKQKWDNFKSKTVTLTGTVKDSLGSVFTTLKSKWDNFKSKSVTLTTNISDGLGWAFEVMRNKWNSISSKTATLTATFNDMFSNGIKWAWNKVADGINGGIDIINKAIPGVKITKIPKLATGAVIPANREFLAVLGDQKQGVNIESPLSTMVDAFRTAADEMLMTNSYASGSTNNYAEMTLDGQTFARLIVPYVISELHRVGYNTRVLED